MDMLHCFWSSVFHLKDYFPLFSSLSIFLAQQLPFGPINNNTQLFYISPLQTLLEIQGPPWLSKLAPTDRNVQADKPLKVVLKS